MTESSILKLLGVAFVVLATLIAFVIAVVVTEGSEQVTYEARIKILVDQPQTMGTPAGISNVNKILQLLPTYAEIITGTPIAQKISAKLNNVSSEEVSQSISATPIDKTQVLIVSVVSSDPEKSTAIAGVAGQVFIEQMEQQQDGDDVESEERLEFSIIEPAAYATVNKPQRSRTILLTAVAATIVATGSVLVFFNARQF